MSPQLEHLENSQLASSCAHLRNVALRFQFSFDQSLHEYEIIAYAFTTTL